MSELRKIRPMAELLTAGERVGFGLRPELRWVAPESLLVDEAYQRGLTPRSRALIRKILAGFMWSKMKPPIVVEVAGGGLHCINGQHTAISACTLRIKEIPVFIVGAASLQERAEAFVAHNRDQLAMTPLDVYRARLAAADSDALDVSNVCRRAGVRLRTINPQARVDVGDCASVGTVSRLVKRQGVVKARLVLEALVMGRRAPIGAAEIHAVEAAMLLVRPATTVEEMGATILAIGDRGVVEARMVAASEGKPHKHMLFQSYMKILEKQTGVVRSIA